MNGNILRRRMVGGKKVEYEEYPSRFRYTFTTSSPNERLVIGYNINGGNCYKVVIDGVDVTDDKNNYVNGTDPTVLVVPTPGEHVVYLQFPNWSGSFYIQLMNNIRLRKDCAIKIRTNSYGNSIQYVDSLSMTPPPLNDALPSSIVQIRVPIGAKAAYDAATYWKDKKSKIVEYDFKFKS